MYIDAPENCPGVTGAGSVNLGGRVTNVNTNPATFALLMTGSGTTATAIDLFDGAVTAIDAPMSISLPTRRWTSRTTSNSRASSSRSRFKVKNNAAIEYDTRIGSITSGSAIRHYEYGSGSYQGGHGRSHRHGCRLWLLNAGRARPHRHREGPPTAVPA